MFWCMESFILKVKVLFLLYNSTIDSMVMLSKFNIGNIASIVSHYDVSAWLVLRGRSWLKGHEYLAEYIPFFLFIATDMYFCIDAFSQTKQRFPLRFSDFCAIFDVWPTLEPWLPDSNTIFRTFIFIWCNKSHEMCFKGNEPFLAAQRDMVIWGKDVDILPSMLT